MRIFNQLVISLALSFGVLNTVLAFFGQRDVSVYFVVDAITYLIITMLYVYLNPRARNALNVVSSVIFVCFLVIVILKVVEILK